MRYEEETYDRLFEEMASAGRIRQSQETYKIRFFLERAENSLLISKHHKDKQPAPGEAEKLHWTYWAITIAYYAMLYAAKAAILTKGYETKDHMAAQVALGRLFVPTQLEKEDLELLDQAHKILEEEYISSFDQARKEGHTARYAAVKNYEQRRVEDIFAKAQKFIKKIRLVIER